MAELISVLFKLSMQGTVIILTVCLLRKLLQMLKVSHRYVVFLWIVPFFYLVFPWKLEVSHGFWRSEAVEVAAQVEGETVTNPGEENLMVILPDTDASESVVARPDRLPQTGNVSAVEDSVTMAALTTRDILKAVASGLWMAGIAAMLGYGLYSYIRLKRQLLLSVPVKDNIYYAENIDTPMVFGVFVQKIYLPVGIEEAYATYVLAHEQTHIRRKDTFLKLATYIVCCIHWWNPFVWLSYFLLSNDMEKACDEDTLLILGVEHKKAYANALLQAAGEHKKKVFVAPVCFDEGDVKGRINNVLKYKKTLKWVAGIAVLAVVVLGVVFLTRNKEDGGEPVENQQQEQSGIQGDHASGDGTNSEGAQADGQPNDVQQSDSEQPSGDGLSTDSEQSDEKQEIVYSGPWEIYTGYLDEIASGHYMFEQEDLDGDGIMDRIYRVYKQDVDRCRYTIEFGNGIKWEMPKDASAYGRPNFRMIDLTRDRKKDIVYLMDFETSSIPQACGNFAIFVNTGEGFEEAKLPYKTTDDTYYAEQYFNYSFEVKEETVLVDVSDIFPKTFELPYGDYTPLYIDKERMEPDYFMHGEEELPSSVVWNYETELIGQKAYVVCNHLMFGSGSSYYMDARLAWEDGRFVVDRVSMDESAGAILGFDDYDRYKASYMVGSTHPIITENSIVREADLDGDGALDKIIFDWRFLKGGSGMFAVQAADGRILYCDDTLSGSHVGWGSYYLYENQGETILFYYNAYNIQGMADYQYRVISFATGEAVCMEEDTVEFPVGWGDESDFRLTSEAVDVEKLVAFAEKVNDYIEHSYLLVSTDQDFIPELEDGGIDCIFGTPEIPRRVYEDFNTMGYTRREYGERPTAKQLAGKAVKWFEQIGQPYEYDDTAD